MDDTLYGYYSQQNLLPTIGHFQVEADLRAHEEHRRRLFTEKLCLPPQVFRGARLLEFGPDAGENSLVFALWGADCTLAEPNLKAHESIRNYFTRFGQTSRLIQLRPEDVARFPAPATETERFDILDAEGFIYTIQPSSLWMRKCAQLTRAGGFVVIFYCESFGSFLELMLKVIHSRYRRLTGTGALEAAERLYGAKWDSIPHKRTMESWTMDVLENPFVRLRYFIEPHALCDGMAREGFDLYSSWPHYRDMLEVHWFKKTLSREEWLRKSAGFIARSRLSHLFGRRHFMARVESGLDAKLWQLLSLTDELVDTFDDAKARQCMVHFAGVASLLQSDAVLAEPADTMMSLRTLESYQRLMPLLIEGRPEQLVEFCNNDEGFIRTWGMPSHFAVFQKAAA